MNYCQSCRRHLNGAVSCPGCGAVGVAAPAEAQDPQSPDWTTEVAWPRRESLPVVESRGAAGGGSDIRARAGGEGPRAVPRPALRGESKSHRSDPAGVGDSAEDFPSVHSDRRSRKRRGFGLRATVTGGFAGIVIIGLLVLGNLPTAHGGDTPVGAVGTVSTSVPRSPGTSSSSAGPTSTLAPAVTAINSGSRATASSSASTGSPSPSSSTTSPSPSASTTPDHSATSAQPGQSTRPSTTPSGAQTSQPATQSTTPPASPSPTPSASKTQVSCILVICW